MLNLHFDMETADPDDVMTLAIAATHPRVNLVGVTLTPGGRDQFTVARHVLRLLGKEHIPVGSADPNRTKPSVSEFHYKWLGKLDPEEGVIPNASEVIERSATSFPDAVLLTGAPLKNIGRYPSGKPFFKTWVGQGGFAGDSVVPPEHRLEKFAGKETCPTFNLNGDVKAALGLLSDPRVEHRTLVSKNVCHGIGWDPAFHERMKAVPRTTGLELVLQGMERYLGQNPRGKLLHDPLALAVAIDPSVATLEPVEVYRHKGEWGSRKSMAGNAHITVAADRDAFFRVLTASG